MKDFPLVSKGSFEMSEQEQAGLVRYCPECGCIGEVTEGCRDCCPDGSHHFYVPDEIARQARAGFLASIYPQPREADILRSHGDWVDAHNCYGRTAGDMARHHAGIVEALAASSAPTAPAQGQEADRKDAAFINSHEFNDTARAALLWVLYHHHGGSSSIGQPIRFALGMGQYDRLSNEQISLAKLWAKLSGDGLAQETGDKNEN